MVINIHIYNFIFVSGKNSLIQLIAELKQRITTAVMYTRVSADGTGSYTEPRVIITYKPFYSLRN